MSSRTGSSRIGGSSPVPASYTGTDATEAEAPEVLLVLSETDAALVDPSATSRAGAPAILPHASTTPAHIPMPHVTEQRETGLVATNDPLTRAVSSILPWNKEVISPGSWRKVAAG
jgi:hypothetical protein